MKVGIMQPYFFPYIGYFQLINACDYFIFLDNVQYIKKGWINKNRVLINGQPSYITIPVVKSPQRSLIRDKLIHPSVDIDKILRKIRYGYKHRPHFAEAYRLLAPIFDGMGDSVARFSSESIMCLSEYIGLKTEFAFASELMADSLNSKFGAEDRIIHLAHAVGGTEYVNMRGGQHLYDYGRFFSENIQLTFIDPHITKYPQPTNEFVPGLSIIDMLMNVPAEKANYFCQKSPQ